MQKTSRLARRGHFLSILAFLPALALAGACGSSSDGGRAPGTVPLGGECRGTAECQAVAGKSVQCRCTDTSSKPLCVADADEGESCAITGNFQNECRPGTVCTLASSSGGDPVCQKLAQAGEDCSAGPGCADPYYCDSSGHCVLGQADKGQACRWMQSATCKAPYFCPMNGVCTEPAPIGGKCESGGIGERSSCVSGAACVMGTCVAQKPDGAECISAEECISGTCSLGQCGTGSLPADVIFSCGSL